MRFFLIIVLGIFPGVVAWKAHANQKSKPHVLVFAKTEGYYHASIPEGIKAIKKLGEENEFFVTATNDATLFNMDSLKHYEAVIFLNTTGDVLNTAQQESFQRYIREGGGFVGIHAASDCEYHWRWYGALVGAWFESHPHQQEAKLMIHKDKKFPVTDYLPNPWIRKDEWYNFSAVPHDVNVLVSIDEKSYEGGTMGASHPLVWYHEYDGGRSFYIGMGHTRVSYIKPFFLDLLNAGIKYAMGAGKN